MKYTIFSGSSNGSSITNDVHAQRVTTELQPKHSKLNVRATILSMNWSTRAFTLSINWSK